MQETSRFNPWTGKIPWRKKWQPTPVFLAEKVHRQRGHIGDSPWGHKELDKTEHKHTHTHTHFLNFNVLFLKLITVYNKNNLIKTVIINN